MKKAKVLPVTVDVECPHCGEYAEDFDSGSLHFVVDWALKGGKVFLCTRCNEYFELPKWITAKRL